MPRRARSLSRADRNAVERERRQHMKNLFSRLALLLRNPPAKPSLPGLVDQAISQIKQMQERVELLRQQKRQLEGSSSTDDQRAGTGDHMMDGSWSSFLTVRELESKLEVCMTSGSNKFLLHEVIQVLEEEAAQVVAISYSNVGNRTFCTVTAQYYQVVTSMASAASALLQAVSARIGVETSRVYERLEELLAC